MGVCIASVAFCCVINSFQHRFGLEIALFRVKVFSDREGEHATRAKGSERQGKGREEGQRGRAESEGRERKRRRRENLLLFEIFEILFEKRSVF